ncbi:CHAT domain-containing protein [Maribacter sp. MAR_2009_72]|uniref:CHAT domain-containing protein n=1 Tax=Maribacter sp. MAR_2009_72 TaxID=1250050 RepID=UPI00164496D9|nr:CHAT domain-containing tetratricopeptide repeat protein [Maribacter sp. MAR_2009_72]
MASWLLSAQDSKLDSEFGKIFMKGYHHITINQDSAYYYFEKALDLSKNQNKIEDILYVYDFLAYTDGYYYHLDKYKNHLDNYEKIVQSISLADSIENIEYYITQALILKGNYYYKLKDNSNSKYYFDQLYKKMSGMDVDKMDKDQLSAYLTSLNFMGLINARQSRLNQSKHYFEKAINLCAKFRERLNEWEERLYNNKKHLSNIYKRQGQYKQATSILKESVSFFEKNYSSKYKNLLITSYLQVSEIYLLQDSIQVAEKVLKKVEKITIPNDHFNKEKKMMLGDFHTKANQYQKAEAYYDSVLHETINYRKESRHQDVAEVYLKLGDLERNRNQLKKSIEYYQQALISASMDFDQNNMIANPDPSSVFSKTQLLTILKKKQEVLSQQLALSFENSISEASTNTSKNIVATLDALRPEFDSKLDKQFLIEQTYPAFHKMIQAAYMGYVATRDKRFLEDAFLFLEKSKGILLLESVKNTEAIAFGAIPERVLDKEQQFRAYITNIEKKLSDDDASIEGRTVLLDSLFTLNTNYNALLSDIEKKHPNYYRLKYDTKTTSVQELQEFIGTDETVLSYHQTEEEFLVLVTTKTDITFLKIQISAKLKQDIEQIYSLLSTQKEGRVDKIKKLGESIYSKILAPCIENDRNTNLTVIADGLLNYIPFDVLVESKTQDYLLKSKNIRYANSATLLTNKSQKRSKKESNLLTISPTFDSNSRLSPLPFNNQEANLISSYFKGKILSGENASLDNFQKMKDDYSLIHFATHALTNDEEPDFSYLAFASQNKGKDRLFIKDLYNYNLKADMVTLSACESGIGKLQNGEGVLSLARGFQYAGVPSLSITLWKNDDQSTSELMGFYYKHLKKGLTKSKALQQAKLDYLNTTDEEELKHPYYWASFVVLGDNAPVSDEPVSPWPLVFGLLGIGILVVGYKKIKAHQAAA